MRRRGPRRARGAASNTTMLVFAVLAASMPSASATRFVAFGDSWAWLGFPQFKEVFATQLNISAALHAIPGTPATYWAVVQPDALIRAVDAFDADAVYLSIGGNDHLGRVPLRGGAHGR